MNCKQVGSQPNILHSGLVVGARFQQVFMQRSTNVYSKLCSVL